MARRSRLTAVVLACAVAFMLMTPVAAVAQHSNSDCALCHGGDSMIQNAVFEAGQVDRDTVCRKCHKDGLVGTHPNHYSGGDCSSMCHKDWGPSIAANVPTFLGSAGAFASPESQNIPAFQIHAIHSTPRWVAGVTTENSKCASCHAIAACTACHDDSVGLDPVHAGHGATRADSTKASATVDPWVGDLAVGVSVSQGEDTVLRGSSLLCGGTACHDIDGIVTSAPFNMDSFNHPAYPELGYAATTVSKVGTWREIPSSNYTLQRQATSNYTNATFSITFTGERVTLVADRDPYRGIAEILIDGASAAAVDQYSSITQYQRPLWTSGDLGPGQHTITLRPTGVRNPNSRATHVTIDKIKVYDSAVDTLVPDCTSCHPAMGDDAHGGEHPTTFTFSHDMTQTIVATNLWNTGYGTHSCDQCHQTALRNEHRRPTASSVSAPDSCSVCHPTYAGYVWTGTYSVTDGCAYGTCHSVSTPREKHGNFAAQHAPTSAGESAACNGCHTGDLRVVHNNSLPGNGKVEANGCLACHGTSKLDTNRSCSGTNSAAGSCHAGGFNTVGTHAIKSAGSHESSEAGKPFTRTYQAIAGLDDGGVECSACHSSGLVAAHAGTVPAVGCSTGGVGGKGCHLDTAYNSVAVASGGWASRKCSDCHDYAAKRSHDNTLTPHLVASNGCAGTGSGCHNSNDLWALHNRSQAGGAPKYQNCVNAGCHDSLAKDKRPAVNFANACGSTSSGCHTGFAPDHTGAFQHTFSAASYYNGATESGCTNQIGCHNQGVASTVDFGAGFHPSAGCLAGACHGTNPSKPSFTGQLPTDCQECHTTGAFSGSAYQGAAPRTSLTAAPGAGGHYNSTSHTAGGMTTALNAGGSANAQCSQCHSPAVGGSANGLMNQHTSIAIAGSPYGSALTCGECHGDSRARGTAEVVAKWTNNLCSDCHAAGTSSVHDHSSSVPAVAEVGSTCGSTGNGCHAQTDLHALHKDAAGCNLTGCHDYSQQAFRPTAKGCGTGGACHTAYTKNTHLHNGDAAKHQPTTLTQANATQFGVACGSCHDIRTSNSSLTLEHSLSTSAKSTNDTNVCLNCHNNAAATTAIGNSWSAKDTTSACAACHTGALVIHANENIAAHSTEANAGCAATGAGCHNGTDLSRVGALNAVNTNIHTSCLRCHDRTGAASWTSAMIGTATNVRFAPGEKRCGQASGCHTSDLYNPVSGVHRVGRGDVVNGNDAKHTAGSMIGTVGTAAKNTCADCHSAGLTNSHPTAMTGWTNTCTSCHNSTLASNVSPTQVKVGWASDACTDCHTSGASAVKIPNMHARYGTNHTGVPIAGNTCDPACHPTMTTLELGDIHSERPNGCQITGCHVLNTQMSTAVAARSCGGTNSCHNGYLDGNHGYNAAKHQTTDENSWKNCGRCHLGYRADYTRGGTFNGNLDIDAETPSGADQLHRNATNGGVGCNTCHDPASRVYDPKGTKTANCSQCHVDHYSHGATNTRYTTTSTSTTNLAKTLTLDFTGMATADVFFDLATTDNAVTANARLEIGPLGSPFYTQTVNTTSMDPNRKKYTFRNIPVAGRTGNQPVRLYVWKGTGTATIINDVFDASVARGNLETLHTADVSGFTCSFGDCHEANIIAEHDKYEIPGAATGNYVWPTNPTRENLSAVQGPAATTLTRVKSLTLDLDEIDKIGLRLNLYHADRRDRTISFQVRIGAAVLASGSYTGTQAQRWWDYRQGGTNPSGGALNYIDTTAYSGLQTIDLWVQTNVASTAAAARNNSFQIWSGEREYLPSTPTDPCDVCHLNTGRVDKHGAPDAGDLNLSTSTPKLAGIGAQCDTCHPDWAIGHPQFGHRASKTSDTCVLGCHQYKPAIDGTALADPYDLTQKHKWGDNTGTGMTYTPGTVLGTENFGTTATWPGTWTLSSGTYVTNQIGSAQGGSGAAPQIGVNTTRTEYNFYRTAAFNTQNYSGGGLLRFWYQVNVGDTSDFLVAEYSTVSATGPYTEIWRRNTDALTWTQTPWLSVPRSSNVWIRFRGTFNTTGEYGRVDTLEMNGANRTFSGTMEGGCATGSTGACHNQGYPARGECQDCHTAVNHHNVVHDLSVGGTRTEALVTGFSFDSCVGTCHTKNLHWNHGVGLAETDPRSYRGPGMASDGIMTCATCHASANTTIRNLANDATTPIASRTLTCGQCHTGTAGMASLGHAGVSTSWRTGQPLRGANLATEFSNTTSVSGHRAGSYTNAFDPNTGTAQQERWWDATRWYMTSGAGRTQFNFNNFTAAPGQTNAAGLLRATVVGPDGTAGTAVPLKAGGTALSTTMSVHCSDCHGESTGNMQGPQGAATNISMLDDFTTRWVDQTNNLIVNNTLICNRCHNVNLGTASTSAHRSNGGHVGSGRTNRCIACHVAIPHAWKRPKLLVNYTRDAGTPYVINPGTSTGSSLRGWTPSGGAASTTFNSSGNCASTGCRSHSGADTVP